MAAMGMIPRPGMPPAPAHPPVPAPAPRPPMPAPQNGPMSGMFLLLSFLAGAGLDKTVQSIAKLGKIGQPDAANPLRAHRGGVRLDAAHNPGMTIAPQFAQMLAAKAGQQPNGSDDLVSLLGRALQLQVGSGASGPIGSLGA